MYTWEIPRKKLSKSQRGGVEFRLKCHLQLNKKKKRKGIGDQLWVGDQEKFGAFTTDKSLAI